MGDRGILEDGLGLLSGHAVGTVPDDPAGTDWAESASAGNLNGELEAELLASAAGPCVGNDDRLPLPLAIAEEHVAASVEDGQRRWHSIGRVHHCEGKVVPHGAGLGGTQGPESSRIPQGIDSPNRLADQARVRGGDLPGRGTSCDRLDGFATKPTRVAQDRAGSARRDGRRGVIGPRPDRGPGIAAPGRGAPVHTNRRAGRT